MRFAGRIRRSGAIFGVTAGVNLLAGGSATNQTGGSIGSRNIGVALVSGGSLTNQVQGLISSSQNIAVYIDGGPGSVNNAGTLYGATAGVFARGGAAKVTNAGTIIGGVGIDFAGTYNDIVIDSGTIIGSAGTAAAFGSGNDLMQLAPGTLLIQGAVNGGGGTNTLAFASGATTGTLTGIAADFTNFGDGMVDAGAQWVLAGSSTFGSGITLTATGTLTDAGTLVNDGTIVVGNYRALQLAPGGYLRNDAGGTISRSTTGATEFDPTVYGGTSGQGTIANFGTIGNTNGNAAIMLRAAGTVTNGSTGTTSALIEANGNAVYIYGSRGTVSNFGTIEGNPADNGDAVVLQAGGVIANGASGSTAGLITGYSYGVLVAQGAGTVTNFGTIAAANRSGDAVHLDSGGTVVDAGTITGTDGGAAIDFGVDGGYGGSNNLLVLEQGFTITGAITASGIGNQLELLGSETAAVTANYNSLDLTNFQTIEFAPAPGNYATLVISNDAKLPGTIAGFIGVHDTIDLTALSDTGSNATTSFNSLTDVLTITGDNGSVSLQLGSESYPGIDWRAQNDGNGGTAIHAEQIVPPVISGTATGQTTTDEATNNPFFNVMIADANPPTQAETLTITLTNGGIATDADGTLSGTGLSQTGTGTYTLVAGSAAAATAELQALTFTPTAAQQVLGLVGSPTGDDIVSSSPNGSSFPAPTQGKNNEAVVTDPSNGATYTLPTGYQAEFLGGSASATLVDPSSGNALLVGNSGNDTQVSGAANDTILGGSGQTTIQFTAGAIGGVAFGGTGNAIILDAGNNDTLSGAAGLTAATTSGAGAVFFSDANDVTVLNTGHSNTLVGRSLQSTFKNISSHWHRGVRRDRQRHHPGCRPQRHAGRRGRQDHGHHDRLRRIVLRPGGRHHRPRHRSQQHAGRRLRPIHLPTHRQRNERRRPRRIRWRNNLECWQ
jgi:hypothetical protein